MTKLGDTQLKVGGYTFTFQPSDIEKVESTIDSGQTTTKIAGSGPMNNINYDLDETGKVITISGALTEAQTTRVAGFTVTTKIAQKQWLESLINGNQGPIELEDDYEGQSILSSAGATPPYLGSFTSTKCMSGRITFRRDRGNPNKIPFTIILNVGTS